MERNSGSRDTKLHATISSYYSLGNFTTRDRRRNKTTAENDVESNLLYWVSELIIGHAAEPFKSLLCATIINSNH